MKNTFFPLALDGHVKAAPPRTTRGACAWFTLTWPLKWLHVGIYINAPREGLSEAQIHYHHCRLLSTNELLCSSSLWLRAHGTARGSLTSCHWSLSSWTPTICWEQKRGSSQSEIPQRPFKANPIAGQELGELQRFRRDRESQSQHLLYWSLVQFLFANRHD